MVGTGGIASFLGEVSNVSFADETNGSLWLVSYGLRLSGRHFGGDFTFLRPVDEEVAFFLGFPFVALTYWSDPLVKTREGPPP